MMGVRALGIPQVAFSSAFGRSSRFLPSIGIGRQCSIRNQQLRFSIRAMATKRVLVPIATGTEEMEAVIVIDILRRAGANVTVASVENELRIVASRNVVLVADAPISSCESENYDVLVLPGGMPGSERLRDCSILQRMFEAQAAEQKLYAAICAAPAVALEAWGLLKGLKATCHPAFVSKLSNQDAVDSRVVVDGCAVTSRAPGTAMEFALCLVEQLFSKEKSDEVSKALILPDQKEKPVAAEFNHQLWAAATKPRVLVPIADGTEEMEAVIIADVLRRSGMDVVVASVEDQLQVVASRKVKIEADKLIADVQSSQYDAIVLPGGMPGAEHLRDSHILTSMLAKQAESGRVVAAICASPAVVLEAEGILKRKKATSYPAFQSKLADQTATASRVVIDGSVATSQGPGTTMEFALAIVEKFSGRDKAEEVAKPMVVQYS